MALIQLCRSDFSKRLNLSSEDGEKWIVNLARDSRLGIDAKIDLQAVSFATLPVYQLMLTPFRRTCSTSPEHIKHPQQPSSKPHVRSRSDPKRSTTPCPRRTRRNEGHPPQERVEMQVDGVEGSRAVRVSRERRRNSSRRHRLRRRLRVREGVVQV